MTPPPRPLRPDIRLEPPARPDVLLDVLRGAFERSRVAAAVIDRQGRILFANASFEGVAGRNHAALAGTQALGVFGAAARERTAFVRALNAGRVWEGELHIARAEAVGGRQAVAVSLSPARDESGQPRFGLLIVEEGGQTAVDEPATSPDIVMVTDPEGTILYINRTVPGMTRDDAIGATVYDFVPSDFHDMLRGHMQDVVRTGKAVSYEIPAVGPYGTTSIYTTQIGPVTRGRNVVALSLITFDITDRARLQQALAASRSRRMDARDKARQVELNPADYDTSPSQRLLSELTPREVEVLALLARGFTNREVAEQLSLSRRTIDHHVSHILTKLEVPNRTAAVFAAEQIGLLESRQSEARDLE